MIGCIPLSLWLGVSGGVQAAPAQDLAAWRARTGAALVLPDDAVVQPVDGGLAVVMRGVSLVLVSVQGDDGIVQAVAGQLAPFTQAGLPVEKTSNVPCTVSGKPAGCTRAEVQVAPGATLHLLAGQASGADWVAVCQWRGSGKAEACAEVIALRGDQ